MMLDLVIIGGGPAGMAATVYACRQNLDFVTISPEIGGLPNKVPHIENYLGYRYVTGHELIDKFRGHVESLSGKKNFLRLDETATDIKKIKGGFEVKTDSKKYQAKSVLIATGRDVKKLRIPGETKFYGRGVSYCPACDAPFYKNMTVVVIGGGRTGLDATFQLLKIAKKIILVEITPRIKADPHMRRLIEASKKVEVHTSTKPLEIVGDQTVSGVYVRKGSKESLIKCQGVFVTVGYTPMTSFLKGFVKRNSMGEIIIDKNNMTSVDGVFAAGDCTDVHEKQIIVAAGEAAKALMSLSMYVNKTDAKG